MHLKVNI